MRLRRLVLAIAAGSILMLVGSGSAHAAGCVSNKRNATPQRWIISGIVSVAWPEIAWRNGTPQPVYTVCFPDIN